MGLLEILGALVLVIIIIGILLYQLGILKVDIEYDKD